MAGDEVPQRAGRMVWRERKTTLSLAGSQVTVILPSKDDPRLVQIAALALAIALRIVLIHRVLSPPQLLSALGAAVVADVALYGARRRFLVFPASALVTGCSVALVLQTSVIWPFALAAALAILSKHLIRIAGRHLFTPSAFGLTAILLAFPHLVHASTNSWEISILLAPILTGGGEMASRRAKTQNLSMWFVPTYVLALGLVTLATQGTILLHSPGSALSSLQMVIFAAEPVFLVFAFYLITDPRTAPLTTSGRRDYALLTAIVGALLSGSGLDRMVALLLALLLSNLAAVLVIDRRYAHEAPVGTGTKMRAPPVIVINAVKRRFEARNKAPKLVQDQAVALPAAAAPADQTIPDGDRVNFGGLGGDASVELRLPEGRM